MKRFSLRNTVEAFPAAADVKALKPLSIIGGLYAMTLDMFVAMVKPPFPWREFLLQTWFVARVSMVPALTLSIPLVVLTSFTFNTLLLEFGAADFSGGTGAALGAVNQIGPFVTVLVVAGAGASAICADLGSRTIREEVDAMRVLGLDPIHSLVVPRVLATTTVAVLLSSVVTVTGLLGAFYFSVYFQHVTPGSFVASMTLITGLSDVLVSLVKATLFGFVAGLIACYQGLRVQKKGAAGVGNAVNETVVIAFLLLFVVNAIVTAVGFEVTK